MNKANLINRAKNTFIKEMGKMNGMWRNWKIENQQENLEIRERLNNRT